MPNSNQPLYGRVGHIEIEDANGNMVSFGGGADSLDFKFTVNKVGDIYTEFTVGILGLGSETINALTVWSPDQALSMCRRVKVYAGYQYTGEILIADGYIWTAIPTSPPEMWLNMKCMKFLDKKDVITNVDKMNDKPLIDIFKKCGSLIGVNRVEWNAKNINGNDKGTFDFKGLTKDMVAHSFGVQFNVICYEENDCLKCIDRHGEYNNPNGDIQVINTQNGLLSIGNIDISGARINIRLNDLYTLYTWVRLESVLMPKANGNYYVIAKKHNGHLRGQDWTTELQLLRYMEGTPK